MEKPTPPQQRHIQRNPQRRPHTPHSAPLRGNDPSPTTKTQSAPESRRALPVAAAASPPAPEHSQTGAPDSSSIPPTSPQNSGTSASTPPPAHSETAAPVCAVWPERPVPRPPESRLSPPHARQASRK